jgi:hypothetical protein
MSEFSSVLLYYKAEAARLDMVMQHWDASNLCQLNYNFTMKP